MRVWLFYSRYWKVDSELYKNAIDSAYNIDWIYFLGGVSKPFENTSSSTTNLRRTGNSWSIMPCIFSKMQTSKFIRVVSTRSIRSSLTNRCRRSLLSIRPRNLQRKIYRIWIRKKQESRQSLGVWASAARGEVWSLHGENLSKIQYELCHPGWVDVKFELNQTDQK